MNAAQVLAVFNQAKQAVDLKVATLEQELIVALWNQVQVLEKTEKQQSHKISMLESQNSDTVASTDATDFLSKFRINSQPH
jgi:hypothetical protein